MNTVYILVLLFVAPGSSQLQVRYDFRQFDSIQECGDAGEKRLEQGRKSVLWATGQCIEIPAAVVAPTPRKDV